MIYRAAVTRALAAMRCGALTVTLPDGSTVRFGEGENPRRSRYGLDARMRIVRDLFFARCARHGDIGLAEGYMAGDWDSDDLAEVIAWFILNAGEEPRKAKLADRIRHALRRNSPRNSRRNIADHYDLSNDFFAAFLDPSMTYSSALFDDDPLRTLEAAQEAKFERLCALMELKEGDRVLEIGGGWGAFSRHAARRYGCHVTTITISREQFAWADACRRAQGLEARVDLQLADYRAVRGRFDKIVSIEMIEAVGHQYFDTFFARCSALLEPNGLVALQAIVCPEARYETLRRGVDFIQKHIFPGGLIPSVGALLASVQRSTDFTLRSMGDFGDSYARTLELWAERFEENRERIRALGFDEVFLRKWRYYFSYCLAAFRMRHVSVVQLLLTRPNNHSLQSAVLR
ncbi:MAG: cyclopropane-fatty-acyl-phospholipid synthase family protein [Acidobacteriota bacterium]